MQQRPFRPIRFGPGGGLGLNLSGSGVTLREWDESAVRPTHQELTGRIVQGDGAVGYSAHSTHVAGTMLATGIDPNAHGMAKLANLRAFDWNSDYAEWPRKLQNGALLSKPFICLHHRLVQCRDLVLVWRHNVSRYEIIISDFIQTIQGSLTQSPLMHHITLFAELPVMTGGKALPRNLSFIMLMTGPTGFCEHCT